MFTTRFLAALAAALTLTASAVLPAAAEPGDAASGPASARWSDGQLDGPFTVRGIVVVNRAHPLRPDYVPAWSSEPDGLRPDVRAAFDRLAGAAASEGLTLSIRSGYRSYAIQQVSFAHALRTYDEATARRYYAEPGMSEHQTGLSLDAWDGRNRGDAFAQTPEAAWLAEHAWEYGFIIRYPQGRTDVTGYGWESWHLRWVGEDVAREFGPHSTLTLEEYLGLA